MLTLTRWNPIDDFATFNREFDHVFGGRSTSTGRGRSADVAWTPAAEVTSNDDGWTIKMALPGIDPKDVTIDLNDRELSVTGERQTGSDTSEKDEKYLSEFGYGRFRRSFTVPDTVAGDDVTAAFENGMLLIKLPVSEATKPRQIAISGAAAS